MDVIDVSRRPNGPSFHGVLIKVPWGPGLRICCGSEESRLVWGLRVPPGHITCYGVLLRPFQSSVRFVDPEMTTRETKVFECIGDGR